MNKKLHVLMKKEKESFFSLTCECSSIKYLYLLSHIGIIKQNNQSFIRKSYYSYVFPAIIRVFVCY